MFTAILFGLSAGFSPGPLQTLVIRHTLQFSVKEGFKIALSPLITDLPIILIAFIILSQLKQVELIFGIISLLGSGFVLYLAYESFTTSTGGAAMITDQPKSLCKGVIINALNPHPYIFWLTVGAPLLIVVKQANVYFPFIFLLCFYSMLVGSKIFLALVTGEFSTFLKSRGYVAIMKILGILLFIFALILFKDSLKFFQII